MRSKVRNNLQFALIYKTEKCNYYTTGKEEIYPWGKLFFVSFD
jgi:hypothetical protein